MGGFRRQKGQNTDYLVMELSIARLWSPSIAGRALLRIRRITPLLNYSSTIAGAKAEDEEEAAEDDEE